MSTPLFEDRLIVCEGECNPELVDRDIAVERYRKMTTALGPDAQIQLRKYDVLSTMSSRLKHTPHIAITNEHYRDGNFCQTYQCSVCGHKREY